MKTSGQKSGDSTSGTLLHSSLLLRAAMVALVGCCHHNVSPDIMNEKQARHAATPG
jgi:hypothetical protein